VSLGTGRRSVAAVVVGIAAVAASISAMRLFPSAAGYLLLAVILALVFLLFREAERGARLRARTERAERRLQSATSNLELAESIDPVTRLASRGSFFERLGQEFRRSQRYQRSLSCVMLDLDHFSSINEQFGEHYGDTVLADFASLFARDLRDSDLAARFEGEAFAIILPETPTPSAVVVAERIRARLKQHVFSNGVVACSLTASFGIAGVPDARITRTDDLVRVAMQALAEAKRRGRDRIVTDLPATAISIAEPIPEREAQDTPAAPPQLPIEPASSNS
jgi:two-component system, cell cycle response regulator